MAKIISLDAYKNRCKDYKLDIIPQRMTEMLRRYDQRAAEKNVVSNALFPEQENKADE